MLIKRSALEDADQASSDRDVQKPYGPGRSSSRFVRRPDQRLTQEPDLRRSLAETAVPAERRSADAFLRRLLAVADLCSAAAAIAVCTILIGGGSFKPAFLLVLPPVLIVSKVIGLYDRDELVLSKSTLDELPALFQLSSLYALLVWLMEDHLLHQRGQIVGLWITLFVFASFGRTVARAFARRVTPPERCIIIGSSSNCRWLSGKLVQATRLNVELVGCIRVEGAAVAPPPELIRDRLRALEVDRAILAPEWGTEADSTLELITNVKALGCKVSLMPRMLEVVGSSVEFDDLEGIPVLGVRRFGLSRSSQAVKRAFDLILSSLLLALMAPVLVAIAIAVRIDSSGGVLFRQTRVGRDGSTFQMLKFRSMVEEAESLKPSLMHLNEAAGLFKISDDPRVTRVGRWLRKTSLDELPQLINVLRGEMSLVGPRPLVREDDCLIQGWHRRRLHLTPGMTGPWQILGASRVPLEEMVTMDYLYIANWRLWADVKILLRTIGHVAARKGC